MVNINPSGPNTVTGRNIPLGPTDALADSTNSFISGGTGAFGVMGLSGDTGLTSITQGITGIALQGQTGIRGLTGIEGFTGTFGLQASTGLRGTTGIANAGITGVQGVTGLAGPTGIQGSQGATGIRGITGLFGDTGLQGITGLFGRTGISPDGITGLLGETGFLGETGLVGATGIPMLGETGLQGTTGLQGATGLLDMLTLDVQRQTSGVTLAYILPASTLNTDGQQLEIFASGLSATDGTSTTLILQLGGYQLFSGSIAFGGGADISLHGFLIRLGVSIQESSIQVVYEDGSGTTQWESITADLTAAQNLIASLTSAGTGHILYSLVARRLRQS